MGLGPKQARVTEIIEHFTDRQREAWDAVQDYRFILYGGARGGGKSRWLRWVLLLLLLYWFYVRGVRDVVVGLFCETYPELQDRQISKISLEFPSWMGELRDSKTHGLGFYLREEFGGGVIALRNLDKPAKYQSAEFAAVAVDELTKITFDTFEILRGSLRWPGISHTVFLAATNPGGIGHAWVKRIWIDGDMPAEMQRIANQFKFVQSLPSDNPHLDEQYWEDLNSLSHDLQRAWVHGDWDVFKGMAFNQFRKEQHVIKPFEIPTHWAKFRGIDWGYDAPMCCLWGATNPNNGRLYIYRELYQRELTDKEQARSILRMTLPDEQILSSYADPALWTRKNMEGIVMTTADEYANNNVPLTKADNGRIGGKRKVDRALADMEDGSPGILIFETCRNLVRTLPALPYDETRVEDVDTKAEDHAYDALRYLLTNYGAKINQPKPCNSQEEKRRQRTVKKLL